MAAVNVEMAQEEQLQEYLAEQAHVQANNNVAMHKQMKTIRFAMRGLTEQAEASKRMARRIVLDKAVASVNQASSGRSVRYHGCGCTLLCA